MAPLGDYEVLGELGRGGAGRVLRVRHRATGEERALKVLTWVTPEGLDRFRREAEVLARVGGRDAVILHEAGVHEGQPYLVLELVPGGSLRDRVKRAGALPWREARDLVATLARKLHRFHEAGLVHRDLKPENVLFDASGAMRIADWGCARDLTAQRLTLTGEAPPGTLDYMAPEQLAGAPTDRRADVFALGVLLHELIAGSIPFSGATAFARATSVRAGRAATASRESDGPAPPELERAIDRAVSVEPAARFATALAFAETLEAIDEPRRAGRIALVSALVALALAVLALTVAIVPGALRRAEEKRSLEARARLEDALLETARATAGREALAFLAAARSLDDLSGGASARTPLLDATLASALAQHGDDGEALVFVDRALARESAPSREALHLARARALIALERVEEARPSVAALRSPPLVEEAARAIGRAEAWSLASDLADGSGPWGASVRAWAAHESSSDPTSDVVKLPPRAPPEVEAMRRTEEARRALLAVSVRRRVEIVAMGGARDLTPRLRNGLVVLAQAWARPPHPLNGRAHLEAVLNVLRAIAVDPGRYVLGPHDGDDWTRQHVVPATLEQLDALAVEIAGRRPDDALECRIVAAWCLADVAQSRRVPRVPADAERIRWLAARPSRRPPFEFLRRDVLARDLERRLVEGQGSLAELLEHLEGASAAIPPWAVSHDGYDERARCEILAADVLLRLAGDERDPARRAELVARADAIGRKGLAREVDPSAIVLATVRESLRADHDAALALVRGRPVDEVARLRDQLSPLEAKGQREYLLQGELERRLGWDAEANLRKGITAEVAAGGLAYFFRDGWHARDSHLALGLHLLARGGDARRDEALRELRSGLEGAGVPPLVWLRAEGEEALRR